MLVYHHLIHDPDSTGATQPRDADTAELFSLVRANLSSAGQHES
jgi:hypothetical protein